jgi:hypothetical protein
MAMIADASSKAAPLRSDLAKRGMALPPVLRKA